KSESNEINQRLPAYIAARIVNHSPITPLRKLRAHHLGQFISVEPVCHRLVFECCRCEGKQVLILPENGSYAVPSKCPTKDCRSRSFEPLLNHPDTLTVDTQVSVCNLFDYYLLKCFFHFIAYYYFKIVN
ncbi:unnamed protein product, partial [Trichobilharzia regenti]